MKNYYYYYYHYYHHLQNKAILDDLVSLSPTELRWKCIELSLPLQNELKPYTVGNIDEEENSLLKVKKLMRSI